MIPETFHRVWVGGPEPSWLQGFAGTWTQHNPGWTLCQWDDVQVERLRPLVNQDVYDRAELLAGKLAGQLRADVLRLELLWRFGGVYVDADFEAVAPLGPLIEDVGLFAAWEKQDVWVNNAIMGASREHPFVGRLIEDLPRSVAENAGARPATMSGPKWLTRMVQDHGPDMVVFDQRLFYPYGHRDVRRVDPSQRWDGAVAVHHWANKRRERRRR